MSLRKLATSVAVVGSIGLAYHITTSTPSPTLSEGTPSEQTGVSSTFGRVREGAGNCPYTFIPQRSVEITQPTNSE
jgi:hypothetical protein